MRKSILTGLCLVLLAQISASMPCQAQSRRGKKPKEAASVINQAYEEIKRKRKEYVEKYSTSLFELAEICVEKKLTKQGLPILDTILKLYEPPRNRRKTGGAGVAVTDEPRDPRAAKLRRVRQKALTEEEQKQLEEIRAKVKELRAKLAPSTSSTAAEVPFDKLLDRRFQSARKKFVGYMVKLAQPCLDQYFPAHGFEVLLWVLPFHPDNKDLRKALGQGTNPRNRKDKGWYTNWERLKLKQGYILHPDYGWCQPVEIKNLEKGYLYYAKQRKWLPKEEVEQLRQKWENAWVHETEHFKITTNAPLRDAVEFGNEVERFYRFFFRVYVDYYTPLNRAPDARLVFGGGLDRSKNKLELHYYASRESYLQEVKKDKVLQKVPNIGLIDSSAGFYYPGTKKAYFYRGANGPDLTVIYHEVTHQIFGETTPSRGPRPPVWMVESFAVLMEDPVVRGDVGSERLLAGAEPPSGVKADSPRDINDFVKNYQVDETFHGGRRGDNYATAGALAHFFIFYKGGMYRKGYLRYAKEAYRNNGADSPIPVSKLYEYTGLSEETLEEEWKKFNKEPELFDF